VKTGQWACDVSNDEYGLFWSQSIKKNKAVSLHAMQAHEGGEEV
jgi:hypothetical protein